MQIFAWLIAFGLSLSAMANVTDINVYRSQRSPEAPITRGELRKPAHLWSILDRLSSGSRTEIATALDELGALDKKMIVDDHQLTQALLETARRYLRRSSWLNRRALDLLSQLPLTNHDDLRSEITHALSLAELNSPPEDYSLSVQQELSKIFDDEAFLDELLAHSENDNHPMDRARSITASVNTLVPRLRSVFGQELARDLITSEQADQLTTLVYTWFMNNGQSDAELVQAYLNVLARPPPVGDLRFGIKVARLKDAVRQTLQASQPLLENFRLVAESPDDFWREMSAQTDLRAFALARLARTPELVYFAIAQVGRTDLSRGQRASLWAALQILDSGPEPIPMVGINQSREDEAVIFAPRLAARLLPRSRGLAVRLNRWLAQRDPSLTLDDEARNMILIEHPPLVPRSLINIARQVTVFRAAVQLKLTDSRLRWRAHEILESVPARDHLAAAFDVMAREAVNYLRSDANAWLGENSDAHFLAPSVPNADARYALATRLAGRSSALRHDLLQFFVGPKYVRSTVHVLVDLDARVRGDIDHWLTEHPDLVRDLDEDIGAFNCIQDLTR